MQIACDYKQRHRFRERLTKRIGRIKRIGKRVDGEADLLSLQVRRRTDRILQRPALARVVGLIEDSVSRADHGLGIATRIPRQAEPRSERGLLRRNQPRPHARIAGIKKPRRSVGKHLGLRSRNEKIYLVVVLGRRKWQLVSKSHVQCQARIDLVSILPVSIHGPVTNFAGKVSTALEKHHRVARQEAGKSVTVREVGEHKEAVAGNALQGIDLIAPVASAKFQLVASVYLAQRAGKIKSILKRVARSRDRVAHRGVSSNLNKRRSSGRRQRRSVLKTQVRWRLVIQVLVQQERIPQKGKARHADGGGRKDVRLLRHEILRAVILSHRKAGNIRSHRRKRIRSRAAAVHVTEIKRVTAGKIMVQPQSELVVILDQRLRGDESIFSNIGKREKRQDIRCRRINRGQLVVRNWDRLRAFGEV